MNYNKGKITTLVEVVNNIKTDITLLYALSTDQFYGEMHRTIYSNIQSEL